MVVRSGDGDERACEWLKSVLEMGIKVCKWLKVCKCLKSVLERDPRTGKWLSVLATGSERGCG